MSNSVDPDEPSHLDLCCLQKPIIIACGSESVKWALYWFNKFKKQHNPLSLLQLHVVCINYMQNNNILDKSSKQGT